MEFINYGLEIDSDSEDDEQVLIIIENGDSDDDSSEGNEWMEVNDINSNIHGQFVPDLSWK